MCVGDCALCMMDSSIWCAMTHLRRIHRRKTLPVHHSTPNAKLCQIFEMKIGHLHCRILMSKAW